MKYTVHIGGGSTMGSDHRNANRNNQDSYAIRTGENHVVGVVADGCGSGTRSEFASHLLTLRFVEQLNERLDYIQSVLFNHRDRPEKYARMKRAMWDNLVQQTAILMEGVLNATLRPKIPSNKEDMRHFTEILKDYGLSTVIIIIADEDHGAIWNIGDGNWARTVVLPNTEEPIAHWHTLEPCEGNMPPYLAYAIDPRIDFENKELLQPRLACTFGHHSETRMMGVSIMTDGFVSTEPTHQELIKRLATEPVFADNPFKTTQILNKMNRGKQKILWEEKRVEREPSAFKDDATVVFIQYREVESS